MLINRNNYETFFLLYVDGELSAAEKNAVEVFATANTDLAHELALLKATVLAEDETTFSGKADLFRHTEIGESLQEKLLMKVDGELRDYELIALNAVLANDVTAAAELALLQRTKLDASEKIIFADKQLLYRKEREKVVIGRFLRWAAAAALLGFGLFLGISFFKKHNSVNVSGSGGIATTNRTKDSNNGAGVKQNMATLPVAKDQQQQTQLPQPNIVLANDAQHDQQKGLAGNATVKNKNGSDGNNDRQAILPKKDADENYTVIKKEDMPIPAPVIKEEKKTEMARVILPKKTTAPDNNIVPLENAYASAVSLSENDKSDNKILYIDEDDVKRSKAGGLFRKVKRFVERTAKVKTGSTIRIAGFALAAD